MIFRVHAEPFHKLIIVILGSGKGQGLVPQGCRENQIGRFSGVLGKFRQGEPGCATDEDFGIEPQFHALPHQERRIHDVGDHIDQVRLELLDLDEERFEIHAAVFVAFRHDHLDAEALTDLLELFRTG